MALAKAKCKQLPSCATKRDALHYVPYSLLRGVSDTKVKDISPGSGGHNLVVNVLSVETVFDKPRSDGAHIRIAEVLVGDETACIVLKARNGTLLLHTLPQRIESPTSSL